MIGVSSHGYSQNSGAGDDVSFFAGKHPRAPLAHKARAVCWCMSKHRQTIDHRGMAPTECPPGRAVSAFPRTAFRAHFINIPLAGVGFIGHQKKTALVVRQNRAVHFPRARSERPRLAARERNCVKMRVAGPLGLKEYVPYHLSSSPVSRCPARPDQPIPGPPIQASS